MFSLRSFFSSCVPSTTKWLIARAVSKRASSGKPAPKAKPVSKAASAKSSKLKQTGTAEAPPSKHRSRDPNKIKGANVSSTAWLRRQETDPYVKQARQLGFRTRAAFKLQQIDDKLKLLKRGLRVVDLGASPGGWSQVAAMRINAGGLISNAKVGTLVAVDLLSIDPIPGVHIVTGDIEHTKVVTAVQELLGGQLADVVLSDMAPSFTGISDLDHSRCVTLVQIAMEFCQQSLRAGGCLVAKLIQGAEQHEVKQQLLELFETVKVQKPPASRADSSEFFYVATGFGQGKRRLTDADSDDLLGK